MELLQITTAKFIIKCDGSFCYKVRQRKVVTRILIFFGPHDLPTNARAFSFLASLEM